eukprot:UN00547
MSNGLYRKSLTINFSRIYLNFFRFLIRDWNCSSYCLDIWKMICLIFFK